MYKECVIFILYPPYFWFSWLFFNGGKGKIKHRSQTGKIGNCDLQRKRNEDQESEQHFNTLMKCDVALIQSGNARTKGMY